MDYTSNMVATLQNSDLIILTSSTVFLLFTSAKVPVKNVSHFSFNSSGFSEKKIKISSFFYQSFRKI